MPIRVLVEDEGEWEFPDDATDEEIVAAINREMGSGPRGLPPLPPGFRLDDEPTEAGLPPLPPGFVLDEVPRRPAPAPMVAEHSAGTPAGRPALPPPTNPLRVALLARRQAAGGAPLASLGPEAVQAAGAAAAPPLPQTEGPGLLEGTPQALGAGLVDVGRSAAAMPRVAARLGEGLADAVLGEAAGALVRKLGEMAPQRVAGDFLEEKLMKPASEFYEGGEAARRDTREAPVSEKLQEPGWLLRQGLRQVPQLATSLGSAGATTAPKLARLAAPFVMEAGETARNLEAHEEQTGEKLGNLAFGGAVVGKGAAAAGLELAGAEAILGRLAKFAPAGVKKRIGMTATKLVTGSLGEGGTERAQNLVGNFAEMMATEKPSMRDLFERAKTAEFWQELDRGGAESQVLGSLLGTGGSVATAAGTMRRAGRIGDARARSEAEATWRAEDPEGRRTVPPETIDAINEGVRALQNPETADEGLRKLKLQTEALDARLQGLREPGTPRAPEARSPMPPPPAPPRGADEAIGRWKDEGSALDARLREIEARLGIPQPPEPAPRAPHPEAPASEKPAPFEGETVRLPGQARTPSTRAREEEDAIETPEEADRSFLEGLGLTPEQAREVGARMPTSDDVTGYATARHHGPALERAQAWAERTGQPAQYVEIDVHNLGGMNAALGHAGADRVLRGITQAVRTQFPKEPGRRVSFIRHGGDELSLVAAGYTEEEIDERMGRAEVAVSEVVRGAGLSDIPHAKGATDETGRERRRGAGIVWGAAPIEPGVPLSRTREVADFAVEARKFTRRAEDVDRKQAVPSRYPAGPRPGGDATPDRGGRASGPGGTPEEARGERATEGPATDRGPRPGTDAGGVVRGPRQTAARAREADAETGSPEGEDGGAQRSSAGREDRTDPNTPTRAREAFGRRFGEDAPGFDRFLALAEMVRQEAPDASLEEAHEAASVLLEEERKLAPRGADVDARAGAPHPGDARAVRAVAERAGRAEGAPREVAPSRAVARSAARDPNPGARGIPVRELAAAVARAEETWPAAPEIAVVRDESELPLEVQQALGGARVRGIYHGGRHGDPSSGTVFLLADRVSSVAEAFETLVHELVGHAGVMAVLGPRGWRETVRGVLESREGRRLVKEWMDGPGAVYAFDLETEAGREGAVAETVAWIAERRLSSPSYTPPAFYRRVLAKVRLWLRGLGRRFGITPEVLAWNEEDIDALLASAARRLEDGPRAGGMGTWYAKDGEAAPPVPESALSEAQRRRVAELVSRTRERLAETDPRWRVLGEEVARGNQTNPDTPTRAGEDRTNPDTLTREGGRPDLANPGLEEEGRGLVDRVDSARTEAEEPIRRADAEVNAEADRRLEADWEGERRALLTRGRQGAGLDDVETVAAKKIISAEAFAAMKARDVETLAETAELIDAYRRTGTAQAQAFRQRRDEVKSPRERMAAFVAEAVLRPGEETAERMRTGTPAQRREALRRHGEQAKAVLEKLRERGIDVAELSDEDLADRFLVARVVREVAAARADLSDKVFEYWANAILSGPLTHIANVTGNTVSLAVEYGIQQPLEMALGSVAGGGRSLAEGRALYGSVFRGVVRGARNAAEAFQTEQRALGEAGDPLAPDRLEARVAIGGRTGRAVRIPYRFLRAADEFYRGLIGEMEAAATAHGIARREGLTGEALEERMTALLEDGESAAWQSASDRADLLTFQDELGRFGRIVLEARRKIPGLRYILPFVTTPANIFKTALRKSPAGAVRSLYLLSRRELSRDEAIRTGAEQLIGLGVVALLAEGIGGGADEEEPWITGTVPFRGSRKGERNLAERTAPPLSVRIGGRWYGYGRLEPLATWLGITVDGLRGVKEARGGKEPDAVIGDALKRFAGQLEDKTFLDGVGRIIRAIDDGRSALRVVGDVAGGFVPSLLRQPAQALEGKVRESRAWGAGPSPKHEGERYESRLARRIAERAAPFAFEGTPRVNAYGEDVEKPNRTFLGRLLSPVQRFDPESLPADVRRIDAAFRSWNEKNPDAAFYPPLPDPRWTRGGRTYYLSDEEYRTLLRRTGILARKRLRSLLDDAGGAFGEEEIGKARKAFQRAAREARKSLKGPRASGVEDEEARP
ncbi:MAG: diguanylate cyclase domain-containing protein [Thermoanaerobaculia bacterium]